MKKKRSLSILRNKNLSSYSLKSKKKLSFPISILNKKLTILESVVKYLKEKHSFSLREIADVIGRDKRNVWSIYNKARKKHPKKFIIGSKKLNIPISILATKKLSALASLVLYLRKDLSLSYSKIATLTKRDYQTIWTVYSRADKKIKNLKKKVNLPKIKLIFLSCIILFSLFGFLLMSYEGGGITGFASFSIYPEEQTTQETTEEQFGIQPIEDLTVTKEKESGFKIQPVEKLELQTENETLQIQDFSILAIPTQNTPFVGAHLLTNTNLETIDDNIVGYWQFEVNADDETGVNNGTVTGATHTHEGRVGKAYEFDGDDEISGMGINPQGWSEVSICSWIKPAENLDGYAVDLVWDENGPITFGYEGFSGSYINRILFKLYNGSWTTIGGHTTNTSTTTDMLKDNWWHICGTWNGSDMRSYVNGGIVASGSMVGTLAANAAEKIGTGLNGTIDEVIIWNRSLNSSEIRDIYNITKGVHKVKSIYDLASAPNNASDVDGDSLKYIYNWYVNDNSITVINMPFEENGSSSASSTAKDYSGNKLDAVATSSSVFNLTGGVDGFGAYEFNKSGTGTMNIGTSPTFTGYTEISLTAWIKPKENLTGYTAGYVFSKNGPIFFGMEGWSATAVNRITFSLYNGTWRTAGGHTTTTSINMPANTGWYFIAGTWNGSDIKAYINGIEDASTTMSGSIAGSGTVGYIGKNFNGTIDDFRIYNRSLSSAQILALYQNKTNTIVSEETKKNELWHTQIWVNDGQNDSTPANTTTINISSNTKPTVSSIAISPNFPDTNDKLECNATVYDYDEVDTMTVNFTWYNGTTYYSSYEYTGINNSQIINYTLTGGIQYDTEVWNCTIFANDGIEDSSLVSTTKTIHSKECGSTPQEDCTISLSTTFNTNTYYLNISDSKEILKINVSNIIVDCNGSKFIGNNDSYSYYFFNISSYNNITIKNCYIENYKYGIYAKNTGNNTFLNNTINNTYYDQISLIGSSYNIIENNTLHNHTITIASGIKLEDYSSYNNITNNTIYNNYYGIYLLSGSDNNKIDNNYVYNFTKRGIYNSNTSYNVFNENTIKKTISGAGNQYYGYAPVYEEDSVNSNYTYNTFEGPITYIVDSNNTYFFSNTHTGCASTTVYNLLITGHCDNILVKNNTFYNGANGLTLTPLGSYEINITDNTIDTQDVGLSISGTGTTRIYNNTFKNITMQYDNYNLGVSVANAQNVYIQDNNISEIASAGIWLRNCTGIEIKNNTFNAIPMSQRSNYLAVDANEAPVAIYIGETYKTWTSTSDETAADNRTNKLYLFKSDNVTIANNTFGSDTQVMMRLQGASNITHDLTDYWYRSFQAPVYLLDKDEFYISNNFKNVSNYHSGVINNTLYQGYRWQKMIYYKLFSNFMYFKNVNNTETYTVRLYNLSLAGSYNDVYDITNSKILSCNQDQYNATLSPNQEINVSDYSDLCPTAGQGGISRGGRSKIIKETPIADYILTQKEPTQFISGKENDAFTFTLDKKTAHEIKFLKITENMLSLSINSPIILLLNLGDAKELDLNDDNIKDIDVTLDSIDKYNKVANIILKRIYAVKVIEEGITEETHEEAPIKKLKLTDKAQNIINIIINEIKQFSKDIIYIIKGDIINKLKLIPAQIKKYTTKLTLPLKTPINRTYKTAKEIICPILLIELSILAVLISCIASSIKPKLKENTTYRNIRKILISLIPISIFIKVLTDQPLTSDIFYFGIIPIILPLIIILLILYLKKHKRRKRR